GSALTTGNNDVLIGNIGVAGESDTICIGDPAIHAGIFLAGITAMNPAAPNQAVLVDPDTGQLGSADISSFGVVSTDPGNTAVGAQALLTNTDGDSNNAIGDYALGFNTTGSRNQAIGVDELLNNDTSGSNVAIGDSALSQNVQGSYNTVIGYLAGGSVEGT